MLKNKKSQSTSGTLMENIVKYLPWIILFAILLISLFILRGKLGIT